MKLATPWLLSLALASSPALAAPQSAPGAPVAPLTQGSLPDPGSVWSWRVRPAIGARYKMRFFTRTESKLQIPSTGQPGSRAQDVSLTLVSNIEADCEVAGRDAKNATTLKLTYRSCGLSASTVASAVKTDTIKEKQAARLLSRALDDAFVGSVVLVKVAPSGAAWSVVGLDKLRARLSKAFASLPDGNAAARRFAAVGFGDDETYKKGFERLFGVLPPYAVAAGDSWASRSVVPAAGFSLDVQGERLLLSRRAGLATVKESGATSITGTPRFTANFGQASTPGATLTADIQGTLSGASAVDEASGMPREASFGISLSGTETITSTTTPPQIEPLVIRVAFRATSRAVIEPIVTLGA